MASQKTNCLSYPNTSHVHTQSISQGTHPSIIHEQHASKSQGRPIFQFNARSLLPKLTELRIAGKANKPNVITVTETWLSSDVPNEAINLSDYVIASRTDKPHGRQGAKVIIHTKNDISRTNRRDLCAWEESSWVELRLRSPSEKIVLR